MIYVLGGSGANLNFRVIGGTTQPTSPTENMIWVNTDTAITTWDFSFNEPANPAEGMLWFKTSIASSIPFNALKKNKLTAYPASCKQYVDGQWISKTAKTCKDGAFKEWAIYLYNRGDQCTDLTGGWSMTDYSSSSGGGALKGAVFLDDKIELTGAKNGYFGGCGTVNKVDLTYFSEIFAVSHGTSDTRELSIATSKTYAHGAYRVASVSLLDAQPDEAVALDISGLTGEYYISIRSGADNTPAYFTEIFLR